MPVKFEKSLLICVVCILIWISLLGDAEGKGGRGGGRGVGRGGGYSGGGGGIASPLAGFIVLVILSTCCGCCGCVGICVKISDIGDKKGKAKKDEEEKKIENDARENTFDPEKSFQSGSQSTQIRLLQDKLTASLIGDAENCLIHAKTRMIPTSKAGYFEIEVLAEGDSGCVEIGLVTSNASDNSDKDVEALPLRQKSFYRYSSTGNKEGSPSVSENCSYGAKFGLGDVVGCALTKRREIFFTLNGGSFGTGFKLGQEEFDGGLHPCIGFSKRGWRIEANFGKKLFQFNLQGLHQKMTWSSIEKSKGIELSEGNLIAKMRANRFTRQLSTDMVLTGNLDAGLVHATNILKPSLSSPGYFEIKIIQEDQSNLFHIALMTPSTDLKVFKETVFCDHSYWLASSGEKNAHGTKWEEYTSLFGLNDVIGCGLTHDRKVFFTLNGDNLGVAFQITEPEFEEGMIPAIRLGKGCGIQANFGKQPFNFDFNTYKDFQNT